MVRTKVFVGNLSFKTQERDLAKEFEVAGKVVSANVITRGSRSLGYGFVELESEEEANKAVQLLNKKEIDGREINVEVARPREENPAGAAPGGSSPAGGAEGGNRAPRRRPFNNAAGPRRRFRQRRPDGEEAPAGGEGPSDGNPAAPRQRRAPRPRTDEERGPRTASSTTLFVTNLPFSLDDGGLSGLFAGLNIKSAHVVRKRNNRSKGFGFVEFNSADDQQKALSAVDKKSVEGREIVVKVALQEDKAAAAAAEASEPAAGEKKN